MSVFTEEQVEYLQSHKWAVLALDEQQRTVLRIKPAKAFMNE